MMTNPTKETQQLDPGPGYRLLQDGEQIEKGDTAYNVRNGEWVAAVNAGSKYGSWLWAHRRKVEMPKPIEPGEGYRLLGIDETIEKGDEFLYVPSGNWEPAHASVGETVRANQSRNRSFPGKPPRHYRRKVETPKPATIDPGAGYRLLGSTEILQEGDEFKIHGRWEKTCNAGMPAEYGCQPYRRKVSAPAIDPGAGYRILGPTEILQEGDQFWKESSKGWIPTEEAGEIAGAGGDLLKYRRNIEQERRDLANKLRAESPVYAPVYHMLSEGETVRNGDESLSGKGFGPVPYATLGTPLLRCNVGLFRRKVEFGFATPAEPTSELRELRVALAAAKGYATELERDCKASDKEIASLTIDARNNEALINELTKERDAFGEALKSIAKLTEVTK